jgi:hypothetical protein
MNDPTFVEQARAICHGASDDAIEDLLWSATCFPFGTTQQVLSQLSLSYTTSGGDIQRAIDDAMAEYREMYPADPMLCADVTHG